MVTLHDRRRDPPRCLICEAWALGDLCPQHQALVDREVPEVLVKRTPPKGEAGHYAVPDLVYLILLFVFILILLRLLGVMW